MSSANPPIDPELERLDAALVHALWRADCPAPDALLGLVWQTLTPDEAAPVQAHLARCPRCRAEMAFIADAAGPGGAPQAAAHPQPQPKPGHTLAEITRALADSAMSGMRIFVAQLLPASEPAFAPLRGTEKSLLYEFETGVVILDIQPAAPGTRTLEGQLLFNDAHAVQPDGQARLRADDDPAPLSQPIDEFGIFHFDGLRPGVYSLRIEGPDFIVVVPSLRTE